MTHKKNALFLGTASGIILALHAYLGSYTRLMADDFCSVYFARRLHMLRYIWYWYLNWGGRYSAIAVDSFIRNIGSAGLPWVPFLVIFLWLGVTAWTLNQILKRELLNHQVQLLAVAFAAVMIVTVITVTPEPQQVLYWWNGMRTYIPAIALFTLQVGFIYWALDKLNTRRKLLLGILVSFVIAFLSAGFNETFTTVLVLFFSGISVLGIMTRKLRFRDSSFWLLAGAAAASMLALLIMFKAPGTANRQGYFKAAPDLTTMLLITLKGFWAYLITSFSTVEKISAWLGLTFTSLWIGLNSEKKNSSSWIMLSVLAGGLMLAFASLLPSAYAFSEMPAARTFVVPTFILVTTLLFSALKLGTWLTNTAMAVHRFKRSFAVLALLLVALATVVNAKLLYDQQDIYINFAQQWDKADAQIQQAKLSNMDSVVIPVAKNWAGLDEPNDNPKFWVNQCYRLYYGITVLGPNPDAQQP